MDNWERRWKLFLVIIQTDQITVKCLVANVKRQAARSGLILLIWRSPSQSKAVVGIMEDIISPMLTVPSESMLLLLFG